MPKNENFSPIEEGRRPLAIREKSDPATGRKWAIKEILAPSSRNTATSAIGLPWSRGCGWARRRMPQRSKWNDCLTDRRTQSGTPASLRGLHGHIASAGHRRVASP